MPTVPIKLFKRSGVLVVAIVRVEWTRSYVSVVLVTTKPQSSIDLWIVFSVAIKIVSFFILCVVLRNLQVTKVPYLFYSHFHEYDVRNGIFTNENM